MGNKKREAIFLTFFTFIYTIKNEGNYNYAFALSANLRFASAKNYPI